LFGNRSHSEFADVVRPHLLRVLAKAMAAGEPGRQAATTAPPNTDVTFIQSQLQRLAAEYAHIRETMPPGDARSRQMEIIVTRMRSIALAAEPLLRSLSESKLPGERLAAISILQVMPQTEYIEWLGGRCSESQPFIGYHAAVALLTSARALDCIHKARLQTAIGQGLTDLGEKRHTDRYRVLTSALQELKARCPQTQ
jgi:hypothetical protein